MSVVPEITVTARKAPSDKVTLKVNGQTIGGWDSVEIGAGMESIPRTFDVSMTARDGLVAKEGDACSVMIGSTKVVSGYIDRDTNAGDANSHRLGLIGRGKCCDLVDCSAEWSGGQISGANALQVVAKLAEPYDINVYLADGADVGPPIQQFNISFGETAWGIIERVTRYAGMMAYEDGIGGLMLNQVGKTKAASGVVYGQNVYAWSVENGQDQRYSDYACSLLTMNTMGDLGPLSTFYNATDTNVVRHRLKYLIVEATEGGPNLCQRRANWDAARQLGRGTLVTATVDSWRDSGGTIWTPNTLIPGVALPGFRLPDTTLVLAHVTYRYSQDGGKSAELTMMPPSAFAIEPVVLQPTLQDLSASMVSA